MNGLSALLEGAHKSPSVKAADGSRRQIGVPGRGGSFDGPGPVVAGGMVYMLSGSAGFVGRPGNVLLAFAPE